MVTMLMVNMLTETVTGRWRGSPHEPPKTEPEDEKSQVNYVTWATCLVRRQGLEPRTR